MIITLINTLNLQPKFGVISTGQTHFLEKLVAQQEMMIKGIEDMVTLQKKASKKPNWIKRMLTERIPSAAIIASTFVLIRKAFAVFIGI